MGTGSTVRARQPLEVPLTAVPREPRIPAASGLLERQAGLLGEMGHDLSRLGALANHRAAEDGAEAGALEGRRAALEGRAPVRDERPAWLFPSAAAFDKAAATGYVAGLEVQLRGERERLAAEAQGDPARFDAAWGKVRDRVTGAAPPELLERLELGLARFGLEGRQAVERVGRQRTLEASQAAALGALEGRRADLARAARAGELRRVQAELLAHEDSLAEALGAGLLSGERAAQLRDLARRDAVEEGWQGRFERQGYSAAGLDAFRAAATPDLDPATKDRLAARYEAELSRREAGRWQGFQDSWGTRIENDPHGARAELERRGGLGGLAAAVEQVESGGRVDAVSPKGAVGVMQLLPATAREVAGRLGLADVAGLDDAALAARLKDPALSRKLGTAYLQELLGRYGNPVLAAAAYNAGPGKVDEWLKAHGDPREGTISEREWVAKIPIAETRAYVPKVLAGAGVAEDPTLRRHLDAARGQAERAVAAREATQRQQYAALRGEVLAGMEPAELRELEAQLPPGSELGRQIAGDRSVAVELRGFTALPLAEQARAIRAATARAEAGQATARDLLRLEGQTKLHGQMVAAAEQDPLGTFARHARRELAPLDLLDPAALAVAMVKRREAAAEAGRWAGRPAAVLTAPEIEGLAGTLTRATAAEQAVLLGNLKDALPAADLEQLMGEVAPKAPVLAAAALLDDRWLREELLAGREALDANPELAPPLSGRAWREVIDKELGEAFGAMPAALGHVRLAARALYARRALAEHDLSGELDAERAERALRDIVGGVLDTDWGEVLPPRRGVDEAGFTRMMNGLEDGDLGPAAPVTASGAPVTAADIRDHGQLVTIGPGRYLVRFGEHWAATADGRRFVLDLSAGARPRVTVPRPPAPAASPAAAVPRASVGSREPAPDPSGQSDPASEPARPPGLPAWVPWGPGGG